MNTIVLEETEQGDSPVPLYQKLSSDRILFLTEEVTDKVACDLAATLMLKDGEDSEAKITLFINSEGGDVRNIFMLYDLMTMISAPVETICLGSCMNECVLLLAAGTPGMRCATPHSMIGLSPLLQDFMTYADMTGVKTLLNQSIEDSKKFIKELVSCSSEQVEKALEAKAFLKPKEAKALGLIDKVVKTNRRAAK
jgi:ATP-dependent Clp protease, protease subunit